MIYHDHAVFTSSEVENYPSWLLSETRCYDLIGCGAQCRTLASLGVSETRRAQVAFLPHLVLDAAPSFLHIKRKAHAQQFQRRVRITRSFEPRYQHNQFSSILHSSSLQLSLPPLPDISLTSSLQISATVAHTAITSSATTDIVKLCLQQPTQRRLPPGTSVVMETGTRKQGTCTRPPVSYLTVQTQSQHSALTLYEAILAKRAWGVTGHDTELGPNKKPKTSSTQTQADGEALLFRPTTLCSPVLLRGRAHACEDRERAPSRRPRQDPR